MDIDLSQPVEITDSAHGGDGIARIDGRVCFVRDAIPGDVVRLRDPKRVRGAWNAGVAEVVTPSPHRIAARCPVFDTCGGCDWLHFAYPGQAEAKRAIVRDSFRRVAGVDVAVVWIEDPALRLGYRTRATFHADEAGWGFFGRGSHAVVPITECPLAHPRLNEALARLATIRRDVDVTITVHPETDETLVWSDEEPDALRTEFPEIQYDGGPGKRQQFEMEGVPIVNGAFSQSSLLLNRLLRDRVREHVGVSETLLDLYCGSGNFSLEYVRDRQVLGVDVSGPAIMAALRASDADYRIGREAEMSDLVNDREWDVVILDPPRAGAKRVTRALATSTVGRIVYVSCDPATLARDSRLLLEAGWRIAAADVVDMFPNTAHVESVVCFERA